MARWVASGNRAWLWPLSKEMGSSGRWLDGAVVGKVSGWLASDAMDTMDAVDTMEPVTCITDST